MPNFTATSTPTATNPTASLEAIITGLRTAPYTACTGSGEPIRSNSKIINGDKVTAQIIGWDERIVFELPYRTGTKPLTLAEAAELLAAA